MARFTSQATTTFSTAEPVALEVHTSAIEEPETSTQTSNELRARFQKLIEVAGLHVLDKSKEIQACVCCLLAGGHVLIEDLPGMGKTTLSKLLAQLLGLDYQRVQFTSDLLPSDILGSSIWNAEQKQFEFQPGPIFSSVVLGDELNRATPRTQSALLQALEERHVSVDGRTHALPEPFFFIATQNPRIQAGTYALPESQLDRFMMRLRLGFPSRQSEMQLVQNKRVDLAVEPIVSATLIKQAQASVRDVHVSDAIAHMIADLLEASRVQQGSIGLSTRAGIQLAQAARAWSWLEGRDFVLPEDLRAIARLVVNHRMVDGSMSVENAYQLSDEMILSLPIR